MIEMKIVADNEIPLIDDLFAGMALVKIPGQSIRRADLMDADVLWVRTVTPVDESLLRQTPVRFVGTATAGYDHLDTRWLARQGIAWAYAPGANAAAVAEYVLCVVAQLRALGLLSGHSRRAGVIGVGRVGGAVARYLTRIGFEVILNDPPRALREPEFHSTPLAQFADLDLICIHAALTREGPYPSYHLLDNDFLQRQKPGAVLLNAARGAVLDTQVLLRQSHLTLCLDVWENEPEINLELLRRAAIATPHIAAYTKDAKRRASLFLYREMGKIFDLPTRDFDVDQGAVSESAIIDWEKRALTVFNPLALTENMRRLLLPGPRDTAQKFLQLRQNYVWRDSFL